MADTIVDKLTIYAVNIMFIDILGTATTQKVSDDVTTKMLEIPGLKISQLMVNETTKKVDDQLSKQFAHIVTKEVNGKKTLVVISDADVPPMPTM